MMSSCCPGNNVSRPSTTVEMGFLSYKELPLLLWSLISSQCCNQLLALRGATSADSTRCRLKRSATADTRNMHIHMHGLHTHTRTLNCIPDGLYVPYIRTLNIEYFYKATSAFLLQIINGWVKLPEKQPSQILVHLLWFN